VAWDSSVLAAVSALGLPAIGRSIEGRPIAGARFGGAGRPLVIVGGVHGDEPASVEAVVDLVYRRRDTTAAAAWPAPVWIIPALNPDGIARGSKNSARDVDLNRNFPARSFSSTHAPGYFPGAAPLSEPETRALADLVDAQPIRGVVAVHAPFACINYDGPAAAWAAAVAAASGWPARADIGYPTPGSLGSWVGVDRGLPILTIELPPGALSAFQGPAAAALEAALAFQNL
jgi:murein peptide amidase A